MTENNNKGIFRRFVDSLMPEPPESFQSILERAKKEADAANGNGENNQAVDGKMKIQMSKLGMYWSVIKHETSINLWLSTSIN